MLVNVLAVALCLVTLIMLWGIFYQSRQDWRSALLAACIAWASAVVLITETLSLFKAIMFPAVLGAWVLFFLIVVGLWIKVVGTARSLGRDRICP